MQKGIPQMYKIEFYRDKDGNEPIAEYIRDLNAKAVTSKEHRICHKKLIEYMEVLSQYGTRAGKPYLDHIHGDIWELRPTNDRVFFFYWKDNAFLMLHHFIKKTQKTPAREIERAKRNLKDFLERSENDG